MAEQMGKDALREKVSSIVDNRVARNKADNGDSKDGGVQPVKNQKNSIENIKEQADEKKEHKDSDMDDKVQADEEKEQDEDNKPVANKDNNNDDD